LRVLHPSPSPRCKPWLVTVCVHALVSGFGAAIPCGRRERACPQQQAQSLQPMRLAASLPFWRAVRKQGEIPINRAPRRRTQASKCCSAHCQQGRGPAVLPSRPAVCERPGGPQLGAGATRTHSSRRGAPAAASQTAVAHASAIRCGAVFGGAALGICQDCGGHAQAAARPSPTRRQHALQHAPAQHLPGTAARPPPGALLRPALHGGQGASGGSVHTCRFSATTGGSGSAASRSPLEAAVRPAPEPGAPLSAAPAAPPAAPAAAPAALPAL